MSEDLLAVWSRKSWVESANDSDCGFPLQSLPYCVFQDAILKPRIGVGIGDQILDLHRCSGSKLLEGLPACIQRACEAPVLNALMSCDRADLARLRARLMELLDERVDRPTREAVQTALAPASTLKLLKPVEPGNYTDFYASIHHARRVGSLFRPENPLLPNYKYVPIGYHGRASSLIVSGGSVRRPCGQTRADAGAPPVFGPTRFLDYEVEAGFYVGEGNRLGEPIGIGEAGSHIFGISLVNDWSARDVQSWEYQPLGPFLAKSFATSISPWIVPMEAFAPFRTAADPRPTGDPPPLNYLLDAADQKTGAIDISLEAWLLTPAMRAAGIGPHRLSQSNLRELYWTPAQLIAHHTSNGCNLQPGDLLASGTVSGAHASSAGCLLELTANGRQPIRLPNSESRRALEDGDEVTLRGFCRRAGFPDVSLGGCTGTVTPAA